MIYELLLILFIIGGIFSTVTLFYALRRLNQYENMFIQLQQIIEFATARMKQIDSSGHYESDDETGFFFEQLKILQLTLDGIFEAVEDKK
jgi:hypothetical protein